MEGSYFMSRGKTLAQFPLLKDEKLRGSLVYYDGQFYSFPRGGESGSLPRTSLCTGQHNDSRMNMALAMTAVHQGAVAANHTEVVALHKDSNGKLNGARLKDNITGDEWDVKAKVCILQEHGVNTRGS